MPRRLPPHANWDANIAREELIAGTPGVDLAVGDLQVRASPVPLFRRDEAGGLEQAIRFRVRSSEATEGVAFLVRAGERVVDRTTERVPEGATSFHLFVPEVERATPFRVEVAAPGGDEASAEVEVGPQRKWSVFLVHHSHFDYGYTDPQAVVMEHQFRYLDAVLDLVAATDGFPNDAAFRWNVEVTYPLRQWLAARPRAAREEFVARAKQGRIEVNALPFSMHTEAYSIDELAWGLRFADELRERYDLEIVSAIQSDVPGHAVGLRNLLVAAGIRYLAVAHNYAGRSVPFRVGGQELTRPFYWGAADKRLLVWQTDTAHGLAYMEGSLVGLAEREEVARGLLPDYLAALAARPYPYGRQMMGWFDLPPEVPRTKRPYPHDILHLRIQGMFADNAPPSLAIAELVRDWNARWAYPRLRMATNRDFFRLAEERLEGRIETFEGDWTDWWADGIGSGALPLGLNRRAQGAVRTGQTLHALADAVTGEPSPAATDETDRVYDDLALFDEHTWGAANPWETSLERMDSGALQWGRKAAFAYEAFDRANVLIDAGLRRFAAAFRPAPEALASILVFNPSGWQRTDLVRVFLPAERVAPGRPITVIDPASGRTVPHVVEPQEHPRFRARGQWLTFTAGEVPPVGYARFDVVAGGEERPATDDVADPLTLETRFYRVRCDPRDGFIASIVDRETERELVDGDAPFGFNEYIYERYGTAPTFNHLSSRIEAVDLTLFGSRSTAGHASIVARSSDAVRERLTLRLVAEGAAWLETTVTLPHDVKRVEIANRLQKVATLDKESVFFAFPFAVDDPDPSYEITGGVTSQGAPHVPGSARHMLAIRHWLALRDGRGSAAWATLEAPLIELGTIALPYAPFPPTIPADRARPSTVYSWAMNNIWDTNFPPQQGGETTFRYAVGSDAASSARELGMRTAAALTAPFVGLCLAPGRSEPPAVQPARGSFCDVAESLVEVVAIAPSRRNHDLVVLLHSLAPETVEARLSFPALPVQRAFAGTFLERDLREVALVDGGARVVLTSGAFVAVALDLTE